MWGIKSKKKTRVEILAAASKARGRGRVGRAIKEYQKLLDEDPDDREAHARIAPLLSRKKRYDESWTSFSRAAQIFLDQGFETKALSIYVQSTDSLPRNLDAWQTVANLQFKMGRRPDAIQVLLKSIKNFKGKRFRREGILLMRQAFEIQPWEPKVTRNLILLLHAEGEIMESARLARGLADRSDGKERRKALWMVFRATPGFRTAWGWFREFIF
ncbi:tetratricopeptide repeat protein [Myxococcota bacterium]|nr:tetratricopeptide repeat protein [Myxococcota bacterium]